MTRDTIDEMIDGTSTTSSYDSVGGIVGDEDLAAPTGYTEAEQSWAQAIDGQQPGSTGVGVMQDSGSESGDKLQDAASSVASGASNIASTVVDRARQTTETQLSTRMDQATQTLDEVAQAVRRTGESLREGQQPMIAEVTDRAAQRVEDVALYLRGKQPADLIRDAESFARREPVLFLGGGLALGWFIARFLKSGPPQDQQSSGSTYASQQRMGYANTATSRVDGGTWDA